MIRQLGKPTIFLTLSAGEQIWPELIQALNKLHNNENLTLMQAYELEKHEKTKLIQADPVTCARYFDYKSVKFMMFLKENESIFHDYKVEDSYSRVEFQVRGSPHEHIFLWLKNAPLYNKDAESVERCTTFIDKFITCQHDVNNPYVALQKHKHSHTCYKGQRTKQCRFHYPIPVMPKTMILEPLSSEETTDDLKRVFKDIKNYMQYLYTKQVDITFDEILAKLSLNEEKYIMAIRSSLKRTQVFLKRSSLEVGINCYNKKIQYLFESNMDIQFVLDPYAAAMYIVNYVAKIESGLSKLMRDAAADVEEGNNSVKDKFKRIANVFLNANLMSAQEAAYHVLSLPLSKMSRQSVYINTSPACERVLMLKSEKELAKLDKESNDVYVTGSISKYSNRPKTMENVCLADFIAEYKKGSSQKVNENEDEDLSEANIYSCRNKPAIIRYRRYKLIQDNHNYYREQIMLFLPWRNESNEVENISCENKYFQNLETITQNRAKYSILGDEELDNALEQAQQIATDETQDEIDEDFCKIDLFEQGGKDATKKQSFTRFTVPARTKAEEIMIFMQKLNVRQRKIVMHVYKQIITCEKPLRLFLSGSAGVGKSLVIKAIFQLVTSYFDNQPGGNKDDIVVLLCAPSGKAAFLINGMTLHTAFALPVSQFGGQMPQLSSDLANKIRNKLINLKLLIIDEISMVGSTLFSRVDTRLRQVLGINKSFGGISVICVGDLQQLPPVMDTHIFKASIHNDIHIFLDVNPLWDEFEFYELTEIMRQKNEIEFITALNNLAQNSMSEEDLKLITSRQVSDTDVPTEAIRLFAENQHVDDFNIEKIRKIPGTLYECEAKDIILGKVNDTTRTSVLKSIKNKKISEVNGLPHVLCLKVGVKYMITTNIDIEDGIVNGSCGDLKLLTFKPNTNEPCTLWLDFHDKKIGKKARIEHKYEMENLKIPSNFTPITKITISLNISNKLQFPVLRQQFPVVPAEALTIHKSQGQTYNSICIDFNKIKRITRSLLYVALSRVTSLSGLYILGKFRSPKSTKEEDPVIKEIIRLKTKKQICLQVDDFATKEGVKIIYKNVCSIRKKIEHIKSDEFYNVGNVLIFAESLLTDADEVEIPGFEVIYKTKSKDQTLGLICFKKVSCEICNFYYLIDSDEKSHVELITFEIGDVTLITGYKSPKATRVLFEKSFIRLKKQAELKNKINKLLVMGDFNFNMLNKNDLLYLENFFSRFGLRSNLAQDVTTTHLNTQIDIVFSNLNSIEADVYETYFSYHKPIYVTLLNNERTKQRFNIGDVEKSHETNNIENFVPPKKTTLITTSDRLKYIQSKIISLSKSDISEKMFIEIVSDIILTHLTDFNEMRSEILIARSFIYNPKIDIIDKHIEINLGELNNKLKIIRITGDGNCMYRAISYCLSRSEEYYIHLKLICIQTIMDHKTIFKNLIEQKIIEHDTLKQLILNCAEDRIYGNEGSLYALSLALKNTITIICKRTRGNRDHILDIVPFNADYTAPIIIYLSDAHYSAVVLTEDFTFPRDDKFIVGLHIV